MKSLTFGLLFCWTIFASHALAKSASAKKCHLATTCGTCLKLKGCKFCAEDLALAAEGYCAAKCAVDDVHVKKCRTIPPTATPPEIDDASTAAEEATGTNEEGATVISAQTTSHSGGESPEATSTGAEHVTGTSEEESTGTGEEASTGTGEEATGTNEEASTGTGEADPPEAASTDAEHATGTSKEASTGTGEEATGTEGEESTDTGGAAPPGATSTSHEPVLGCDHEADCGKCKRMHGCKFCAKDAKGTHGKCMSTCDHLMDLKVCPAASTSTPKPTGTGAESTHMSETTMPEETTAKHEVTHCMQERDCSTCQKLQLSGGCKWCQLDDQPDGCGVCSPTCYGGIELLLCPAKTTTTTTAPPKPSPVKHCMEERECGKCKQLKVDGGCKWCTLDGKLEGCGVCTPTCQGVFEVMTCPSSSSTSTRSTTEAEEIGTGSEGTETGMETSEESTEPVEEDGSTTTGEEASTNEEFSSHAEEDPCAVYKKGDCIGCLRDADNDCHFCAPNENTLGEGICSRAECKAPLVEIEGSMCMAKSRDFLLGPRSGPVSSNDIKHCKRCIEQQKQYSRTAKRCVAADDATHDAKDLISDKKKCSTETDESSSASQSSTSIATAITSILTLLLNSRL